MYRIAAFFLLLFFTYAPIYGEEAPPAPYTEETFYYEFINMIVTLGLLIALLLVGTWLMKKMMASRQRFANEGSEIKVLEQRSLSTKSALYLVEVQETTVLIAESQNSVTLLTEIKKKSTPQ